MPKVSVLLPVYNTEPYVKGAVESILLQTFSDFELIIINDGSTDGSQKIIDSFKDPRIVKLKQPNKGLVASLNKGLAMAHGQYTARQDADDVSMPTRLEKQVKYLDSNPSVIVVGCNLLTLEKGKKPREIKYPPDDATIRLGLFSWSSIPHGAAMYRTAVVRGIKYRQPGWPAEDYDLWPRLAPLGKFANIDEPLYKMRLNREGISFSDLPRQTAKIIEIRRGVFKEARIVLQSPLVLRRSLSRRNSRTIKHNAWLLTRVSIMRIRPLNTLFMLAAILIALPLILRPSRYE